MTVKLAGTTHTGATVLSEQGSVCKVRCACGQEFIKDRTLLLKLRATGFHLRCWQCKRLARSENASRQAAARGGWVC